MQVALSSSGRYTGSQREIFKERQISSVKHCHTLKIKKIPLKFRRYMSFRYEEGKENGKDVLKSVFVF